MKKNLRKKIGVSILILIVAFWGLVFFMRNKNPDWCNLSWGTYDIENHPIIRGEHAGAMEMTNMPSFRKVGDCDGGIFGFMD
jgi:hypothetical protein